MGATLNIPQYSGNPGTVTSIGLSTSTTGVTVGSSPVTSSGTITVNIATASGSATGLLSSTDWTTFNNKQAALGYTPVTNARTLTINGTTYDLTADRTWTITSLPTQTSNSGKFLTTDGSSASWAIVTNPSSNLFNYYNFI